MFHVSNVFRCSNVSKCSHVSKISNVSKFDSSCLKKSVEKRLPLVTDMPIDAIYAIASKHNCYLYIVIICKLWTTWLKPSKCWMLNITEVLHRYAIRLHTYVCITLYGLFVVLYRVLCMVQTGRDILWPPMAIQLTSVCHPISTIFCNFFYYFQAFKLDINIFLALENWDQGS